MRSSLSSLKEALLAIGAVFLIVLMIAAVLAWLMPPIAHASPVVRLNSLEHAPE